MIYQHIRQATALINFNGTQFLIDPMLSKKGEMPAFEPAKNGSLEKNPTVNLPISIDAVLHSVDAVILTHLHPDHWDIAASKLLKKDIPIFVQNETDKLIILEQGFLNVSILNNNTIINDICLIKTKGHHGRSPEMVKLAGEVCGVIFKHKDEKTLYLAGDTVWYDDIEQTVLEYKPEIVVVNAGGNAFVEGGALIMEPEDVRIVAHNLPHSTIIAVHMEATNHNFVSREELRQFSNEHNFNLQLAIPFDGETLKF